jgi:hypothetical protein
MASASYDGAALRCAAVVLAIVVLTPVPLALPSEVGLAVIWLVGAALLLNQSRRWGTGSPHVARRPV